MNRLHVIVFATLLTAIAQPSTSSAGDNTVVLRKPYRNWQTRLPLPQARELPSRKTAAPLDAATLQSSVDQRMRVLFDRAVDPSTHLVTAESARKAGVGIIADQFADIDKDHNGTLAFTEVSGFFDARLAAAKPAVDNAQTPVAKPVSGEVQIIE
jgi:hypothetical protein